ncbi:MAG: preprotein translocase subunit SecA, partial [Verrucomicrobiales bacterium]
MVIGTERHTRRRFDRKWQGLCAAQGAPGESIFFISFEDRLMRQYGAADRMTKLMNWTGFAEGEVLEGEWLNRSITTAQKRLENVAYTAWKRGGQFDAVLNQQWKHISGYRDEVLRSVCPRALILEVIEDILPARVQDFLSIQEEGNGTGHEALIHWVNTTFPIRLTGKSAEDLHGLSAEEIVAILDPRIRSAYELKMAHESPEHADELEKFILLGAIDRLWGVHLQAMTNLREVAGSTNQSQEDPVVEYEKQAYDLFVRLMGSIKGEILNNLFRKKSIPDAIRTAQQESDSGTGLKKN